MFLIKCKCGCFFTVKKENLATDFYQCQSCKNKIPVSTYTLDTNDTISHIPDNAKITVTFDV